MSFIQLPLIQLPKTFHSWKKKHFLDQPIHPQLLSWLLDRSSLTQRIIKHCIAHHSQFRVQLLKQTTALPSFSDASVLQMKVRQWAYIREVMLYCGKTPVVYAKTIIPLKTLTGKQRRLAFLANRPLGAFLFAQANLHRDPIEISPINNKNQQLIARRSAFYLQNKPLLVYEVFLPDFIHAIVNSSQHNTEYEK